jgi:hypothetical protein
MPRSGRLTTVPFQYPSARPAPASPSSLTDAHLTAAGKPPPGPSKLAVRASDAHWPQPCAPRVRAAATPGSPAAWTQAPDRPR